MGQIKPAWDAYWQCGLRETGLIEHALNLAVYGEEKSISTNVIAMLCAF